MKGHPLSQGSGLGEGGTGTGGSKGANCPGDGALVLGMESQWEDGVLGSGHSLVGQANQLGVSLTRVQIPYLHGLRQVPSSFGVSAYPSVMWACSNRPGTF